VQPESTAAASGARGDVVRGDVVRAASVDTAEIAVGPGDAPTPLAPTIDEVPRVEISATLTSPPRAPDRGPERAPFAALIEDMAVDDAAVDEGDEPTLLPDGDIVEVPAFVREIRPTRPLCDDEDEDDRADAPPPAAASTGDEHPRPRRIRSDSSIDEA
jgi:hypothetical protein